MSRSRSRAAKSNGIGTVRIVSASRSPGPSSHPANGPGPFEKGKSGSVVVRNGSPARSPVRRGRRLSVRDLAAVGRGVVRRARSNDSNVDLADDSSSSASSSRTQTRASTPPTSVGPSDDEGASAKDSDKERTPLYPAPFLPPSLLTEEGREPVAPPKLPSYFPPFPDEHLKASDKVDKADEGTPDSWIKRDGRLVRLTGKHPFNCEAPIRPLFEAGFLTPASLFYVRNHGAVPRVDMDQAAAWTIEISGLVKKKVSLSLHDLQSGLNGACPTVTLPVTFVCAGNRRKEQNVMRKSLGFNWGAGGLSTALFTGVYLCDVLDHVGVQKGAKHVIFEGADKLPNGPYGTSQKLPWARDRTKGMMLSWAMNGLPLEPDHGYPLRVVIPGQIGGRSVKWLKKVEVSAQESQHHLHFWDNKVLPTQVMPEEARNERHWWYDPKYIINDLNTNSAIACPDHDERLDVTPAPESTDPEAVFPPRIYTLRGYAYAGGGRRVARIEYSLDECKSWKLAEITYPEDLYRAVLVEDDPVWGTLDLENRTTCFCWCFWAAEVTLEKLGNADSIQIRAMDEGMAVQPAEMYWNATGMMNNWYFRVKINKEEADGKKVLHFEHPTVAGVKEGGWMQKLKDEEGMEALIRPQFSVKDLAEAAEGIKKQKPKKEEVKMTKDDVKKTITMDEVKAHNKEEEPWFIVNGEVYDGTAFLDKHPGGPESITLNAGEDASEDFMAIHSADAKRQLADFHIGTLEGAGKKDDAGPEPIEPTFLHKTKWRPVKLSTISHISHDTRIFRFALQAPDQDLGLPTGQHVFVRLRRKEKAEGEKKEGQTETVEGELVQRAYTPVSNQAAKGFIDLLIKIYFPTDQFPAGGKMTGGFAELDIGDVIEMKGPLGSFVWKGDGVCSWRGKERTCRKFGLICGGSGITPIIQVIRGVLDDPTDSETQLWLLDGNRTLKDILLYDELKGLAKANPDRFKMHHVLSGKPEPKDWDGSIGWIGEDHIRDHLPPPGDDAMVLICGPPAMIDKASKPNLEKLGWDLGKNMVIF